MPPRYNVRSHGGDSHFGRRPPAAAAARPAGGACSAEDYRIRFVYIVGEISYAAPVYNVGSRRASPARPAPSVRVPARAATASRRRVRSLRPQGRGRSGRKIRSLSLAAPVAFSARASTSRAHRRIAHGTFRHTSSLGCAENNIACRGFIARLTSFVSDAKPLMDCSFHPTARRQWSCRRSSVSFSAPSAARCRPFAPTSSCGQ